MDKHVRVAEHLVEMLENRFNIFGFRFGLDPILGLISGAGDLVTLFVGAYFIWIAKKLKLPNAAISIMISNIMLDFIIGLIPLIGDLFDFSFKAHLKNLQIIQSHISSDNMKNSLDSVRTT